MYAALIGEVDGVRLLTSETLASAAKEQASGKDQVMLIPSRFSSGYMLPTETNPMIGPNSSVTQAEAAHLVSPTRSRASPSAMR